MHDDGEHVVGWACPLLGDERGSVLEHSLLRGTAATTGWRRRVTGPDVEPWVDRLPQVVTIRFGHAEQDADHLHRELGGNIREKVDFHAVLDVGKQ